MAVTPEKNALEGMYSGGGAAKKALLGFSYSNTNNNAYKSWYVCNIIDLYLLYIIYVCSKFFEQSNVVNHFMLAQ